MKSVEMFYNSCEKCPTKLLNLKLQVKISKKPFFYLDKSFAEDIAH